MEDAQHTSLPDSTGSRSQSKKIRARRRTGKKVKNKSNSCFVLYSSNKFSWFLDLMRLQMDLRGKTPKQKPTSCQKWGGGSRCRMVLESPGTLPKRTAEASGYSLVSRYDKTLSKAAVPHPPNVVLLIQTMW